jgi:4-hydroxy-2-oxoheptanedioate aldolase
MRGKKASPMVRVAANQPDQICFALDGGARGIVAPMINTRAQAEAMVSACRYYPGGHPQQRRHARRVGGSRTTANTWTT